MRPLVLPEEAGGAPGERAGREGREGVKGWEVWQEDWGRGAQGGWGETEGRVGKAERGQEDTVEAGAGAKGEGLAGARGGMVRVAWEGQEVRDLEVDKVGEEREGEAVETAVTDTTD